MRHRSIMSILVDNTILLFYRDYEKDTFFKNDRYLKRAIRPLYHALSRRQKVTGFLVWYRLLAQALRANGYTVLENDYRYARRHPDYPVGLVGFFCLFVGLSFLFFAVLGFV